VIKYEYYKIISGTDIRCSLKIYNKKEGGFQRR